MWILRFLYLKKLSHCLWLKVSGCPLRRSHSFNWLCAGGSKIEAQTPDGTRVATPNLSKDGPSTSRQMMSSKASYAAALKAKPSDWHLQFSMDDHILPLDLTVYGAMHQHEMRKKSGPLPPSLIWQGVYTVKFKKINGPLPLSESELPCPPLGRNMFAHHRCRSCR